jgi:hypothetical protein
MHTAKVVIHEVKRDGGNVILQLLRERIGQPLNRRMLIRMVRFWRSTKWPTRVANDAVVFRQNSSPLIPTNRRATLSEAEGEVWLSWRDPDSSSAAMPHQGVLPKLFHPPAPIASLLPDSLPLDMPSRIPRPHPTPRTISMRCSRPGSFLRTQWRG